MSHKPDFMVSPDCVSCKEKKIETGTSAIETDGVDGNTAIGRINSHIPRTTIEGNLCDKGIKGESF